MSGLELEPQPEELLLRAVEAPWKEESDEVSSGEKVEGLASVAAAWGTSIEEIEERKQWAGWSRQRGKQRKKVAQQRGAGEKQQGRGRWSMPGFSADPGSAVMVAGSYVSRAVQTQVVLQGVAGEEIWLGVDLQRGGANITSCMGAEWRAAEEGGK